MKLCITEKPSVARDIARIVGASTRKDGYLEGNGYCVTWGFGHFCELEEPRFYNDRWKSWSLDQLPMIPQKYEIRLKEDPGVVKQFTLVKKLLMISDEVINCGDAGIEGELIQRWLLKMAGYQKPHKRLWISSLTDQAIRSGFKNLRRSAEFDNLFHAGFVRAIGDWLLGMNATRIYTLKSGNSNTLLTVGRVQTPTLALIVKRHKEILNFKPETYWQVVTVYRDTRFLHQKKRFKTREEAQDVLAAIINQPLQIDTIEGKEQKIMPPMLFDLTTLQVECHKRFGYPAAKTLQIAQKLYENKMITYPRVDCQYLTNDMITKMPIVVESLSKSKIYGNFTDMISPEPLHMARYFNNNKVTDHHAIIPTGQKNIRCSTDENRVFDLVVRRFLAMFFPDAVEFKTKVTALTAGHRFFASGKILKIPGWKTVYQTTNDKKDKTEQVLPVFTVGETGPHSPAMETKETQPPKRYTEATLLRAMETCGKLVDDDVLREALKANGIGRPSTRAAILENLFQRNYLIRDKKNIVPTEKGIYLIDSIQDDTLKSPVLTGEWENKLRRIESGDYGVGQFNSELNRYVTSLVENVKHSTHQGPPLPDSLKTPQHGEPIDHGIAPCPKCKTGTVVENDKAYGCSNWRSGCDFTIWKTIAGKKISPTQAKSLLQKGNTRLLKGFVSKQGKKFNAILVLEEAGKVTFRFESGPAKHS